MSRRQLNKVFSIISWSALVFCGAVLGFFLWEIFRQGVQAISLDFIIAPAKNFGAEGGIFYQIIGSLILIIFAGLMSLPVALGVAIYKSEYLNHPGLQQISDLILYALNAVPSVIFGIFGLIFFVNILQTGLSWFVGSVILAIMILPTIVLSCYQAIRSIPDTYRETARSFGFSEWQVVTHVVLPQGAGGAITGLLIGLARAVGETAPIMFIATAYSGVGFPGSFNSPVSALPTHILSLAKQATRQQALSNAWGAGLVLLMIVLVLSLAALISREKFKLSVQR